jgi:tetratricopeptide (TPR) repeat protein
MKEGFKGILYLGTFSPALTPLCKKIPAVLFLLITGWSVFAQTRPDALQEYRNGNYERSIAICLDEIRASPQNLEAHVVICWSLLRLSRYEEAMIYARTGRNINRYDVRITEILGEINYFEGRNNEALQYFQEYINLAPEGQRIETVYYFIGEIYIRMGRFRHADIALSTAVHWVPGNAAWWTRLAYARENAGDLTEAVNAYERALSLNPQLSDARRGLDRTRQALGSR